MGGWIPGGSANNVRIIRLAYIILWRAEVAAAENELSKATQLVNVIRERADNYHVQEGGVVDGTHPNDAANYKIGLYPTFSDQEYAWKAIKFEHRLEFYMEGFRFFNLVRWGDAAQVISEYLEREKPANLTLIYRQSTIDNNRQSTIVNPPGCSPAPPYDTILRSTVRSIPGGLH